MNKKSKSREEKVQDLECMLEDLESIEHGLPGNFPNSDEEKLALRQVEALITTIRHSIQLHNMKQEDRTAQELRRSRGQS